MRASWRAADLGNNRILAGMHSPLDVTGGRIEATAIVATNVYNANGNRLDWTNPANAAAYAVDQAHIQTQKYLAQSCGTSTVEKCIDKTESRADRGRDEAREAPDQPVPKNATALATKAS